MTPGTWKAFNRTVYVVGPDGQKLPRGQRSAGDSFPLVGQAFDFDDAILFAAAPDLLAALKGVLRITDRKTVEWDAVHAAIAKAEGK